LKIILVLPYLTRIGGAARYAWELGEFLTNKEDDVVLVSLYTDTKLYSSKNIKIINLADTTFLPQSIKFWVNLSNIQQKLTNIVKNENPDLVLFNHFPSTLWAQKFQNIPVLCYPQDMELLYSNTYTSNLPIITRNLWKFFRLFVRYYEKKKWKNFDLVIANSNFSRKKLADKYKTKLSMIYPGTNTTVFLPMEKNFEEKSILLIADGKVRRADFALKNIKKILEKRHDFKIWIAGNTGDYDKELKEFVKDEGMEDHVIFFGRVSDSKLRELYAKTHVFVHLQRIQPFGLVFTEAMSCGTPVIACKPGAPEEVIKNGITGFLIDEYDGDMLIEFIEKILDNPKQSVEMGIAGRQRVQENFESTKQYEKLRTLLMNCIRTHHQ
jgi:glycosyltransferase involved in cell wall biosynthesis